jgi:DNA-binding MarR family transcriptional regulator
MEELKEDPGWLAWYAQVSMHTRLLDYLASECERTTGMPAAWFEVLIKLRNGEARMNELADALFLSRGGATRLIARMEEAGLVERHTPPSDRRATFAVITDAGREAVDRWLPVHLELVREAFGRHLREGEAEVLIAVAARISEAHGWPAKALAPAEAQ